MTGTKYQASNISTLSTQNMTKPTPKITANQTITTSRHLSLSTQNTAKTTSKITVIQPTSTVKISTITIKTVATTQSKVIPPVTTKSYIIPTYFYAPTTKPSKGK